MPTWIDTHCHLDAAEFDADRDAVRAAALAAGVAHIVIPAVQRSHWQEVIALAHRHGDSYALGIHPLYTPGAEEGTADERPGTIELFVEPNDGRVVENADNLTVSPWGDLFVCEDGPGSKEALSNRLLRVTPGGEVSTFASNAKSESEFAGVCFSPDGSTMFVNIQADGLTLAINGPWRT